jgi:phenylpropionate dioxygenase-like ring-hydroxylating dioxygenase large terminal subunit
MIGTQVDDSPAGMARKVAAQKLKTGFAIDSYFYRSHIVYEKELDEILFKSWLYAGHVSQVPNSGDFFQYELGEDAVIVTRDPEGEIHALLNVCRHRGARVCEPASGNAKVFACPYHGWVYNLDGSLRAARAMEMKEGFKPENYGLKHARVTVYEGLIFINCDSSAVDFRPSLDKIADALAPYDLGSAKIAHREVYKVSANWKLALENYLECYHCAPAHRSYAKLHSLQDLDERVSGLNEAMRARAAEQTGVPGVTLEHSEIYTESTARGNSVYSSRYALYDGFVSGSEGGQPVAPLMGKFTGYDGGAGDFQMGPLTFMLNYPDHCVLYRFTPRGITDTDMEIVWYVRGDAEEGKDYDREALIWLWHNTTREDEYIIMRNSAGVNSRFFEPGPYHPEFESQSLDFVNWYLGILEQAAREASPT